MTLNDQDRELLHATIKIALTDTLGAFKKEWREERDKAIATALERHSFLCPFGQEFARSKLYLMGVMSAVSAMMYVLIALGKLIWDLVKYKGGNG